MYHFSQTLNLPFAEVVKQVTEALQQEGMGVLTEIDVQSSLKKKLEVDFQPYKILGACHPRIAYRMLQIDNKAGVFYPCNVVVQQREDGLVEVSAVNPEAMFLALPSPEAKEVAADARKIMEAVINRLKVPVAV